ncbi:MAG: hypothetical protein M0Q12_06535 [Synergistaceae bacterium]|nr:hypothetical protein [Synergistaceae bacterium]MDD4500550.1 FISUMP domain-containing protein [Bacteroidales bacterium]
MAENAVSTKQVVTFTALPGVYRAYDGSFNEIGEYGHWWNSNLYPSDTRIAWFFDLYYNDRYISMGGLLKYNGFSVRCIKD